MRTWIAALAAALMAGCGQEAQTAPQSPPPASMQSSGWEQLLDAAPFPKSYNFPVFVAQDGRFIVLHPEGTWESRDARIWTPTPLPHRVLNSAYMSYVQHDGAVWALGRHTGDYRQFAITPTILRTRDFQSWERVGQATRFPQVVFAAAASFKGALWMFGGYDGQGNVASVWRSSDGLQWERVTDRAPWGPRGGSKTVVFKDRLYLIGGGVLDGPNSNDVWSTGDGTTWRQETVSLAPEAPTGFTPVAMRDAIWLVGANRSGAFKSEMLVSNDGQRWTPVSAPWSPRGGVAAWTDGASLYVTGGKYSTVQNGETVFAYSNDVWVMRPSPQ